jgi:glycosyltransferase involved in cell wall biosynthesis
MTERPKPSIPDMTARSQPSISDLTEQPKPSISAVVAAYQAERFIGEALDSILSQTRPPDEVVVVDDGSTDGTARELARFGERIRVIRQPNRGYQVAMSRAISEARGDFVALCGADDVWKPRKLEWQEQAIMAHPDVDVFFGHAMLFGRVDAAQVRPPGTGVLDDKLLRHSLFRVNSICCPSVALRRELFERLGPFVERFEGDDYDYWFRCLRAGARFYYDPRVLMGHRRHEHNMTNDKMAVCRALSTVHFWHEDLIDDRRLVREVHALDLFRIGRLLVDQGRPREALRTFRRSLRYPSRATASLSLRALAWVAILSLPELARERAGRALVGFSRALTGLRGAGRPALS